ncbi:MAG: AMP-binding protein [Lachnospira sp.]|nr:AMP-binding protein [Lachnospira sp.]
MKNNMTFYEFLKNNAMEYGDNPAVLYDTFEVSHKTLFEDAVNKAIHLRRFAGEKIAIYGPASYRWIVNVFGTILAGKDAVLVDFFVPQDVRSDMLAKTKMDYILCSTNQYILSDADATIIDGAEKDDVTGLSYDESLAEGNIIMFTAIREESDKPVVLDMKDLLNTVVNVNGYCKCTSDDRVLAQISWHYIMGLLYTLIWPLSNGACVCVGRGLRHIDSDTFYYNPTILPGTPSMIEHVKRCKAFNEELRMVIVGGAPCSDKLYEELSQKSFDLYMVYGMEQTTGSIAVSCNNKDSYEMFDAKNIRIAGDGEILVSGACVMVGYDNDVEANTRVITEGWLHTGDYGRINDEGRLEVIKRNPDIILLSTGEKISRLVMDREISSLPGIVEGHVELKEDKLVAVVTPIESGANPDKIKMRIDRYNDKKGYRFRIQDVEVRG